MSVWMDGGRLVVTFGEGSDEETVRVGSDLNDDITISVDTIKIEKYVRIR